jgi:hypothetical protein
MRPWHMACYLTNQPICTKKQGNERDCADNHQDDYSFFLLMA